MEKRHPLVFILILVELGLVVLSTGYLAPTIHCVIATKSLCPSVHSVKINLFLLLLIYVHNFSANPRKLWKPIFDKIFDQIMTVLLCHLLASELFWWLDAVYRYSLAMVFVITGTCILWLLRKYNLLWWLAHRK